MKDFQTFTTESQENAMGQELYVNKPPVLPLIALRGKVVFPNTTAILDVGRKVSLNALKASKEHDNLIFLATQKDVFIDNPLREDIYEIGVVARVESVTSFSPGNNKVGVKCLYRAKMQDFYKQEDMLAVTVKKLFYLPADGSEAEASLRFCKELFLEFFLFDKRAQNEAVAVITRQDDANMFIDNALNYLPFKEKDLQEILEEDDTLIRLELFRDLLTREIEIAKIEKKISEKVKESIDKGQKDYLLREQLKAIHNELGDDEEEYESLKRRITEKHLPKEVEEKALKELSRLDKINPSSPDYSVITNYLDWILDLPFNEYTEDTEKLADVKQALDEDHYGLEKVKERIIEYIAVLKLTKELKSPILCFVGPPGVGKTSVAKSIARALNRKFVRMSLGGLKDESEIRGHRKTYVGAMPGRIINGIKQAGSSNPVFLLDEIDKLSKDITGDPSSALLEVLDPEQNSTFRDRYMEIPYDLSKVMFITTANTFDIPAPLLDRMEVIEVNSYTEEEKIEIAKRHLIPKQIELNGLTKQNIAFTPSVIKEIIEGYTSEAGVRNLEREIGTVCRKVACKVADKEAEKVKVDGTNLKEFLGVKKYSKDKANKKDLIGVANGLAWTSVGGTTLPVEVGLAEGKGEFVLTGKIGDVMQESARAAYTYIKIHGKKYGITPKQFEKTTVHIHVPEGAVPKNGPSAGITIATAILSAFIKKPIRKDVAMTGEITLLGKVLPIGGLKEKALAAYRLGIKEVLIPEENVPNLEDIPESIRNKLRFTAVSDVEEVFERAIKNL